jgi:phosphoribosylformylglycinamidine (FGAM) synthase PurS component
MQVVELYVELKIPDVTALTAAGTLRRRLGYDGVLTELNRGDYYRISLDVDTQEEALELATEMAENTNIFVNPNKHRYTVFAGRHNAVTVPEAGETAVNVLVLDPAGGSGSAIADALRDRLGYGETVREVVAGTLWTIVLQADDEEARRAAEEITVTKSRTEGLLMNPHYQDCEMW